MASRDFRPRSRSREEFYKKKNQRYYFLIVTNGEKTEYNYFSDLSKDLPKGSIQIKTVIKNGSPMAVVKKALKLATTEELPDECWAVFDKDQFPDFDNAVSKLKNNNRVHAAYSNPSFELWVLIHFQNVTSQIDQKSCIAKLNPYFKKHTQKEYEKNGQIYKILNEHGDHEKACKSAEIMFKQAGSQKPWMKNPTTEIHKLFKKLQNIS